MYEYLRSGLDSNVWQKDFGAIKLKLRGMMNVATFQGLKTKVLGVEVASPISVGPLPIDLDSIRVAVSTVEDLAISDKIVQQTCSQRLVTYPLGSGYAHLAAPATWVHSSLETFDVEKVLKQAEES